MAKVKVLVLGNDPQINQIDFDSLSPNIITLGINRIWLKYIPNYFFFHDLTISDELLPQPEKLAKLKQNSIIFSSEWIRKGRSFSDTRFPVPTWTSVYPRKNKKHFPDSITNSIELFRDVRNRQEQYVFYVAGVSLTWQEPSHFWKEENIATRNTAGPEWYLPRFEAMLTNFKRLKTHNYEIISVTPNSKLNKLFRYENIGNLYKKSL
jgi:hypothetical protein